MIIIIYNVLLLFFTSKMFNIKSFRIEMNLLFLILTQYYLSIITIISYTTSVNNIFRHKHAGAYMRFMLSDDTFCKQFRSCDIASIIISSYFSVDNDEHRMCWKLRFEQITRVSIEAPTNFKWLVWIRQRYLLNMVSLIYQTFIWTFFSFLLA